MPELHVGRENFTDLQVLLAENAVGLMPVVCVHSRVRDDAHDGWRRAVLEPSIARRFKEEAIRFVEDEELVDQVEEYTFDNMVEGQIGYWGQEDSEEVERFVAAISDSEDAANLDTADRDYTNSLDMFTINLNLGGETVSFVTRSMSSTVVRKRGFSLSLSADNQLVEVDSDIFHFVIQPCVVVWRGAVYILDRTKFENMTGLRSATIEKSIQAFRYIVQDLNIVIPANENLLDVIKAKPVLYRRLASASAKGVLAQLSSQRMVDRIRSLGLPINYAENDDDYEFNVDHEDNNQVKQFVYLMTDYYLHSPVTELEHRAPSTHVNIR